MMQAIPALFAKAGISSTALQVASTVISGISGLAAGSYQSAVAKNNAAIAEENAKRAQQEAAVAAQEGDFEARAEIGQILAQAGASGLSLDSGSMLARRKSAEELSAKDRGYRVYQGDAEAAGYKQQAANFRAEAKAGKTSSIFNFLETGLGVSADLITGASKVNAKKARSITRNGIS